MQEVEYGGRKYRTGKLDAFKQFHLVRKLMPLFSGLGESWAQMPANVDQSNFWHALGPVAQAVAEMSTEDSEWCLKTCLSAVSLFNGRNWVPLMTPAGTMMFDDLEMSDMLQLSFAVLQDNLGSFFPGSQPNGLDNAVSPSPSVLSQ